MLSFLKLKESTDLINKERCGRKSLRPDLKKSAEEIRKAAGKNYAYVYELKFKRIREVAPEIEKAIDFNHNKDLGIFLYHKKYGAIMSQLEKKFDINPNNIKVVTLEKLRAAVADRDAGGSGILK